MALLPQNLAPVFPMPLSASHQMMLEVIPVLAALIQRDGSIVARNSRWFQTLAQPADGQDADAIYHHLPEDICARIADGEDIQATRLKHALASSKPLWIEWSSRTWPEDDSLVLLTGANMTREAELETYITENQWFETAAALSGGLAHDFNNALAGILGLSEIISLRLPPESALHSFTTRICASVDRAKNIVRRFSQFSRKSSGAADAQPTAMILEELLPLLKAFMPSNVNLTSQVDPETPWCSADRHELEHIILNCCTLFRARLRAEGGSLCIACGAAATGTGPEIRLTASCQSFPGLAVDRVFELDLQPSPSAYESGSAGFTARKLAEKSGSSLRMRRDDPRTLTFVLHLPPAS